MSWAGPETMHIHSVFMRDYLHNPGVARQHLHAQAYHSLMKSTHNSIAAYITVHLNIFE